MAFRLEEALWERFATEGTGTITLGGKADGGHSALSEILADADTFDYVMADHMRSARETGKGTYASAGGTVARTTLYWSTRNGAITGATNASPIVITSVAHGLTTGEQVRIRFVGGNTAANGYHTVTVLTADTFSLDASAGNGAYTSGGRWYARVNFGRGTKDLFGHLSAENVLTRDGGLPLTGNLDMDGYDLTDVGAIDFDAATELTIAAGVITVVQAAHKIDTEADAASDDLDTINGFTADGLLLLRRENSGRAVVLKHNTGNILIPGQADLTIPVNGFVLLVYDSSASKWRANVGSLGVQAASAVAITGGTIAGITDLAVADGGTGASTAANARTNLGLGTIATQAANSVSITGGSIATLTTFNTSGSAGIGGVAGSGRLRLLNGFNSSVGQLECLRNDGADNFLSIFGTGTSMLFGVGAVASGAAATDVVIRGNGNNIHFSGGATIRTTMPAAGGILIGGTTAPTNGAKAATYYDNGATNPTPPAGAACMFAKTVSSVVEMFGVDSGGTATQLTAHHDPERAQQAGIVLDPNDPFPRVGYETNCYLGLEAFTYTSPTTGITQRKVRALPADEKQDWTTDQIAQCRACHAARAAWKQSKVEHERLQDEAERRANAERKAWADRRARAWKDGEPDKFTEPEPPAHERDPFVAVEPPMYQPVEPPKWLRDRGVKFDQSRYQAETSVRAD